MSKTLQSIHARLKPLAQYLTVFMPFGFILGVAIPEIIMGLVIVLFLANSLIERNWTWLRDRWLIVLTMLWAYIVIRSSLSILPMESLSRTLPWLHYPVFLAALKHWVLKDAKTQKYLIITLSLTVLFLAADTLLQYFNGRDITGREPFNIARLTGPYRKPYVGIIMTWTAFPVILYLCSLIPTIKDIKNNFKPSFAKIIGIMACIIGTVTAIYLSGERMAFLLCVLGLVVSFLISKAARRVLTPALVLGIIGMIAISATHPVIKERQIDRSSHEIANYWNTAYGGGVRSAFQIWKDHPLFGIGMKTFYEHCVQPEYGSTNPDDLVTRCPTHPHNVYMEWLTESGLLGFALYYLAISFWIVRCFKGRKIILSDPITAGLFATACIRFWPLSATASQFAPWSAAPFWLLIGFLLARIDLLEKNKTH